MVLRKGIVLLLLVASIGLTGCSASRVNIHLITPDDYVLLKEGEEFTAPKQGAFFSDEAVDEVLKARVDK